MVYCCFCGSEMKWNTTYTFEDFEICGDGEVVCYSCLNCDASADFYSAIDEAEQKQLEREKREENLKKSDSET